MAKGDVFISAVTGEFGKARSAIAADLRARDLNVVVQDDFRQEAHADTLLSKLHDYIHTCAAVVCIVGKRSGAFPTPAEAKPFERMGVLPPDIKRASYTQWEFFFAQHFKRRCSVYIGKDDYKPDEASPKASDEAASQAAYVKYLKEQGYDRNGFSNEDQLARAVLKEEWNISGGAHKPTPSRGKPIVLPYPSIGPLFKGRENFLKQLRETLTRKGGGKTAIFNAVYGLGGIGKTRAATEYAWTYQDDYSALLFAIGETPEILRRNLAALSSTLAPQLETTDENARLQITLGWLKANPDWLLILDNLDSKEALAEAQTLTSHFSRGNIIIIPCSLHNPKILGVDDTEIVGDRITEVRPIPRNHFTQEPERRIGKLGASRVGFIVRDVSVHHAP
jgi:hypothetical protein